MSEHPVSNRFSFKELIYSLNLFQIILLFITIFTLLSFGFFLIYDALLEKEIDNLLIFKYAIYQAYGFDIDEIKTKNIFFEYINFIQLFISLVINLIFASSIILKYFTKPNFFHFKNKVNIHDNKLIISLYNKTNFQITNCSFDIYARLPFKDKEKINCLNNIKLKPNREIFPFMDKHLVTRIIINLNVPANQTDFSKDNKNLSLVQLLDKYKKFDNNEIQFLNISVLIHAISDKLDTSIYEIKTYKININSLESINQNVTFDEPKSIDIDMVDFSKSKGWEDFED